MASGHVSRRSNSVIHVVAVYERGKTASLYLDGSLTNVVDIPDDDLFVLNNYPLLSAIGAYDYSPNPFAGFRGILDDLRVYTRALSASEVQQLYQIESHAQSVTLSLVKAVKPAFSSLLPGANYQLQISADMNTWTNHGAPFTAISSTMAYPQYWDVDNWQALFFRLQVALIFKECRFPVIF